MAASAYKPVPSGPDLGYGWPMKRVGHGQTRDATTVEAVANRLRSFAVGAGVASAASSFGYMFPELQQDEANVLKPERATVEALRALGAAMTDAPEVEPVGGAKGPGDSAIPAIYTYFGQFLDHDITFDETSAGMPALASLDLAPLPSLSGCDPAQHEADHRKLDKGEMRARQPLEVLGQTAAAQRR